MASYPNALHAFIVADPDKVGAPLADEHIDAHAELAEELAAVQAVLGTSPAGSHGTVRAALEAAVTDHGALSGLGDDDHAQYALADGSRGSFAATAHTHTAAQINDSTAIGRAVLTAADAATARGSLGAYGYTMIGTQNIDLLLTPGTYTQGTSVGTTTALGYPFDNFAGVIEVMGVPGHSMTVQRATHYTGKSNNRSVWTRARLSTDGWGPWQNLGPDLWSIGQTDLNTLIESGTYLFSNTYPTNAPIGAVAMVEVFSRFTGDQITQRFTPTTSAYTGGVWQRQRLSDVWQPWTQISDIQRNGNPNGVVTAPPGTYYTDEAGTNGAWRWLKKSGTGNTGWDVVIGDTGRRSLIGLVDPDAGFSFGAEPGLHVRRTNNVVSVALTQINRTSAGGAKIVDLPLGFRSAGAYYARSFSNNPFYVTAVLFSSYTSPIESGLSATFITADPWPTSLPGSPS